MAIQEFGDRRPFVRLHVPGALASGAAVALSDAQQHYLGRVMRLSAGDGVALFNGRDGEWRAVLEAAGRRRLAARAERQLRPQGPAPDLWLVFAPVKRAPIDAIATKATELGVAVLQPVLTEFTAVSRVNTGRLAANAVEAAEQCGRLEVPEIREPRSLDAVLGCWPAGRRILLCDESGESPPAAAALGGQPPGAWAVLTGPEGGFSSDELAGLRRRGDVVPAGLGPRILRADTAALAALAVFQAVLGDWRYGAG